MLNASRDRTQHGSSKKITFVKPEFQEKGYTFPGFEAWQQYGYLTSVLWPSRDHIIRIIPGYDPETREIFRQNINVDAFSEDAEYTEYLSDTFMMADTVQRFGEARSAFITSYAPGSADDQKYSGDTMISIFSRNVFWTVKPTKSRRPRFGCIPIMHRWTALKEGTLPLPKRAILVQALVYKLQGDYLKDKDDNYLIAEDGDYLPKIGVIAMDGPTTVHAVLKALVEPANPANNLDALKNNKYGGFAELEGNKMYLNAAVSPEPKPTKYLQPSVHASGTKGWELDMLPFTPDQVYAWWKPWNEIINYLTPAQQAEILAAEFGADAVNYFVGTDPAYRDFEMPESVAAAGYGRFVQFTDGVREVRTSGTVTVPANGTVAPTAPKSSTPLASAFKLPKSPAAPTAPTAPTAPAAPSAPRQAPARGPLIPKGSGVDQSPTGAFANTLGQLRKAAAKPAPQEEESEDYAEGLENDNFDDYEDEQQ